MKQLYDILIHTVALPLKCVAAFNKKIQAGVKGRAASFSTLSKHISSTEATIWFHCASLGEYEQGLPVFQYVRQKYPEHKIVLSFFSPSGYTIRKQSPIADVVVYLPLDTKPNARHFFNLLQPQLVVFVKYDIWPNYLNEIAKRNIHAILISALFRKEQRFFKFYGRWMQKPLAAFEHIFVQDEASKRLLNSIHINQVTLAGDTRFDRVYAQRSIDNTLASIEAFKQNKLCVVAGSTWQDDEALFVAYINTCNDDTKFIIAPHNIKASQIERLTTKITKPSLLFTEREHKNPSHYQVFIIDIIGILPKLYSYADIAYVGGAMGNTGLHNVLEPAVFGVPIIIGHHFSKHPEAYGLLKQGGLFSVSNQGEFNVILKKLEKETVFRLNSGKKNMAYVNNHRGAVAKITQYLNTVI